MSDNKNNPLLNFVANKLANSKALKDLKEEYEKDPEAAKKHFEEKYKINKIASGLDKVNKVLGGVNKATNSVGDIKGIFGLNGKKK